MRFRSVAALALTPLVGGAIPGISYAVALSPSRLGVREAIQIGAWVVLTLLFELVALLPCARYFRASKHFRLRVFVIGLFVWLPLSMAWLFVVFGLPLKDALIPLVQMGISGFAICLTFVALWGRRAPHV
jgi:hypothetical protein